MHAVICIKLCSGNCTVVTVGESDETRKEKNTDVQTFKKHK